MSRVRGSDVWKAGQPQTQDLEREGGSCYRIVIAVPMVDDRKKVEVRFEDQGVVGISLRWIGIVYEMRKKAMIYTMVRNNTRG